jgi:hypothetical protein
VLPGSGITVLATEHCPNQDWKHGGIFPTFGSSGRLRNIEKVVIECSSISVADPHGRIDNHGLIMILENLSISELLMEGWIGVPSRSETFGLQESEAE